jgi:uncharacterized protein
MTPQEQEMIGDLIDRVQKTQLAEKDMDAEQMLQEGLGRNPDALYILAQTVLVQKYALEQAQAQLAQMQRPEPKRATSFLGGLLGRNDPPPPPPPPPPQGYPPAQAYPQAYPQYAPVGYGAPMGMGGGGGFLRGAMQTAAGVAAGALAFEGIESLMHGFGQSAGYGQGLGGFGGRDERPEVINNYYGDDRGERGGHEGSAAERTEGERESREFGGGDDHDLRHASEDNSGGLDERGRNDFADTSSFDDSGSGLDDGGANDFDDSSSFDDGGGSFDDGGGDDGSFA